MLIKITSENQFYVNSKLFVGEFSISSKGITLISGANGVGKSSLFEFLKLNSENLFQEKKLSFLDQKSLIPLNDVSLALTLKNLEPFRREELSLAQTWLESIKDYSKLPINQLSGGQNQMAKIAISLFLGGDCFFFDEPLHFLDKKNKKQFIALLDELTKIGKSIVLIEHQKELLLDMDMREFELFSSNNKIGIKDVR